MTYFEAAQTRKEQDRHAAITACARVPKDPSLYGSGPLIASTDVRIVCWLPRGDLAILAEIIEHGWRAAGRVCYRANPIDHSKVARLAIVAELLLASLTEVSA